MSIVSYQPGHDAWPGHSESRGVTALWTGAPRTGAPDHDTPSGSAELAEDPSIERDRNLHITAGSPTPSGSPAGGRPFDVERGIARGLNAAAETQEPGESPLAVAGVPRLPSPIPRPPRPCRVHRRYPFRAGRRPTGHPAIMPAFHSHKVDRSSGENPRNPVRLFFRIGSCLPPTRSVRRGSRVGRACEAEPTGMSIGAVSCEALAVPNPWITIRTVVAMPCQSRQPQRRGEMKVDQPRLIVWRICLIRSTRRFSRPVTISAWPAIPSFTRPRTAPRPTSSRGIKILTV